MRPLLLIACAAATLAVVVSTSDARACSPACYAPKFPAENQTIPAGATHLPIQVQGRLTIADSSGREIFSGTPKDGVVELGAPLGLGAYTVSHEQEGCGENKGRPFTVGGERIAPGSIGILTPRPTEQLEGRPAGSTNSCQSASAVPARAALSVQFAPSAEMEPWLPLTYFAVTVDGKRVGSEGWGDTQGPHSRPQHDASFVVTTITALCETAPSTWQGGASEVATGKHRVELRARIAGTTTDLPIASTDVDIQCSTKPATLPPIADPNDPANGGNGGSSSSGCSASPHGATPTFGALAVLGVIALAARRRRRA